MRKNSGFSLIELMIVIAIIAIVTAITSPYLITYIYSSKLDSAVVDVQSTMQYAKLRAVRENADVIVTFITGGGNNGTYTAFVNNGASGGADNWIQDGDEATIRSGTMPNNVDMYDVTFSGSTPLQIKFNSRGLPNGTGGHVYMRIASQNRYKGVIVNIAGRPRIVISRAGGATSTWVDE